MLCAAEDELSLYASLALALRYNHNLAQRKLEAAAACAAIEINWADLRPQLNINARTFTRFSSGEASTGGGGGTSSDDEGELTSQLSLNLTQRIYDWGLNSNLVERDRALHAVRVHAVDSAEQQLVFNVIAAYYQFSQALGQLRIRMDALQLAREFLRQTQIRFDVGTAPRLDVIRAEARVEDDAPPSPKRRRRWAIPRRGCLQPARWDYQRYIPAIVSVDLLELGPAAPGLDDAIADGIAHRPKCPASSQRCWRGEQAVRLARNRPRQRLREWRAPAPEHFQWHAAYELGLQLLWNAYTVAARRRSGQKRS